jgi:hypothetical protein
MRLLLEDKLEAEEREHATQHIMDCNDCSVKYVMLKSIPVEDVIKDVFAEEQGEARASEPSPPRVIPIGKYLKSFQKAAAVLLLVGLGYAGGVKYPDVWGALQGPPPLPAGSRGQTILPSGAAGGREFAENRSYRRALNGILWKEVRLSNGGDSAAVALPEDAAFLGSVPVWKSVEESRKVLDERLNRILELSGTGIDAALAVDAVDITALTPENVELYAALLKEGKEAEINYARDWILLDQNLYFSLAGKVPEDIWTRYPASRRSYAIISWIANLPEEQRTEKWRLPSRQAEEEFMRSQGNASGGL